METTVYLVFVTELCAGNRLNVWVSGAPSGAFWGWGEAIAPVGRMGKTKAQSGLGTCHGGGVRAGIVFQGTLASVPARVFLGSG